ncbi:hypothetical protein GCK32_009776 [Trichostrongylus colubriformis]|uniref:Uncharacterized protein n=1 Tax=Trichostrongylus colubriformis TaxID=6319 RepID=A0AAN8FNQ6_TRICO
MNSSSSSSVQVNEDVAIIILRHLAEECYLDGPYTHWMRLRGISKAFDRAVRRYLSKTVKIGFEELAHDIEVFQCFQDCGIGNCTRTLFKSKDAAVAFLRCMASNVDKPIAVDVKDYTEHPEDDEVLKSLCSFRAVESIIHRRPRCECAACEHLVEHAGPDVKLVEALTLSETFVPDGSTPDMFYGWYAVSPTGRDSEMFYRYGYGYPSTRQKTSMTDLSF